MTQEQLYGIMVKKSPSFVPMERLKDKIIRNAVSGYGKGCDESRIIGILDTTIFLTGKAGYILTEDALYGSELGTGSRSKGLVRLPLEDLIRVDKDVNYCVCGYRDGTEIAAWTVSYSKEIVPLLQAVAEANLAEGGSAVQTEVQTEPAASGPEPAAAGPEPEEKEAVSENRGDVPKKEAVSENRGGIPKKAAVSESMGDASKKAAVQALISVLKATAEKKSSADQKEELFFDREDDDWAEDLWSRIADDVFSESTAASADDSGKETEKADDFRGPAASPADDSDTETKKKDDFRKPAASPADDPDAEAEKEDDFSAMFDKMLRDMRLTAGSQSAQGTAAFKPGVQSQTPSGTETAQKVPGSEPGAAQGRTPSGTETAQKVPGSEPGAAQSRTPSGTETAQKVPGSEPGAAQSRTQSGTGTAQKAPAPQPPTWLEAVRDALLPRSSQPSDRPAPRQETWKDAPRPVPQQTQQVSGQTVRGQTPPQQTAGQTPQQQGSWRQESGQPPVPLSGSGQQASNPVSAQQTRPQPRQETSQTWSDAYASAARTVFPDPPQETPSELFEHGKNLWYAGDKEEAFSAFIKAAEAGHGEAKFHVGRMYAMGDGIEKNEAEAMKWYGRILKEESAPKLRMAAGKRMQVIAVHARELYEAGSYEEALNIIKPLADTGDESAKNLVDDIHRQLRRKR